MTGSEFTRILNTQQCCIELNCGIGSVHELSFGLLETVAILSSSTKLLDKNHRSQGGAINEFRIRRDGQKAVVWPISSAAAGS